MERRLKILQLQMNIASIAEAMLKKFSNMNWKFHIILNHEKDEIETFDTWIERAITEDVKVHVERAKLLGLGQYEHIGTIIVPFRYLDNPTLLKAHLWVHCKALIEAHK